MRTLTSTSSTLSLRSSSASSRASSSSLSDTDGLQDLVRVDGFQALPRFVPRDLALGVVPLRDRELGGDSKLLGDRRDPREELLDPPARRQNRSAVEVDERLREPVPDRAPEVLLDQAMRMSRQRLALVHCPGDAGGERVDESGEGLRLGELGLPVTD